MKRLAMAVSLACMLSATALAGEIPTTDKTTPSPGDMRTVNAASPGDLPTTDDASPGDMGNGGLSLALMLLDLVF